MPNFVAAIFFYVIIFTVQFIIPKYLVCNTVYPNFILLYVVYTALNKGPMRGQLTGFFYGLSWDILFTDIFGIRALTLTVAGYISGKFNRNLNKDQAVTQIIIVFICILFTHFSILLLYLLIPGDFINKSAELNVNFLLYCLINVVITPVFFKIMPYICRFFKIN